MMSEKIEKVDFKKEFKVLFSPSAKAPVMVDVPDFKYVMVEGEGDPNVVEQFQEKVGVLYGLSYTIKFMMKKDPVEPFDYTVLPLSGLWHAEDCSAFAGEGRKHEWRWRLMIMQPDRVTADVFEAAKEELRKKKNPAYLDDVRFEVYSEGLCAQIMHVGPYSQEGPTVRKLHDFFQEKGYTFNGLHHEIYLSDPRRAQPERLKTIIRQPVKKV